MTHKRPRCLVTGSTGYIGGRLVPELLRAGLPVRALARNPDKLAQVPWRGQVEVSPGDLADVDSLITAFEGIDVVYYLVHSMGTSKDFVAAEIAAARNVVTAARLTGVRRFVFLGGLSPDGAELSPHLKSRRAVGEVLLNSGIETVVLRAGVVVGSGSASFEMVRHLTDRLPVMTTPKWVHNEIQPIAICDALYYLASAATAQVACSRTWDIGGPDVLEYGDMMRTYAEVAGLGRRYLIVLPFLTPAIASLWVGSVTPLPPGLARPLIESVECDAVMQNHDVDSIITRPAAGLTSYRTALKLALKRTIGGFAEPTWEALDSSPAELSPSDPSWAGPVVYTDVQGGALAANPDRVWQLVEAIPQLRRRPVFPLGQRPDRHADHWRAVERQRGHLLRLQAASRSFGQAWLELQLTSCDVDNVSAYRQRAIFFPRGLPGRIYWFALRPVHTRALRGMARDVLHPAVNRTTTAKRRGINCLREENAK